LTLMPTPQAISEVDRYISKYQRKHLQHRKGDYRIIEDKGCWIWQAATNATKKEVSKFRKLEYGRISLDQGLIDRFSIDGRDARMMRTHVLMFHLYVDSLNGRWLDISKNNLEIGHICNRSLCCKPSHLKLISRLENAQDRVDSRESLIAENDSLSRKLDWWRLIGKEMGILLKEPD